MLADNNLLKEKEQEILKEWKDFDENILNYLKSLSSDKKQKLLQQLNQFDLHYIKELKKYILKTKSRKIPSFEPVDPIFYSEPHVDPLKEKMIHSGERIIKLGKVAVLLVAGGQSSRLGFDKPKGCFKASVIREKTLFQLFAEQICALQEKYQKKLFWYIMTSEENYTDIIRFFEDNNFFNLDKNNIIFFQQGKLPTFTSDGNLLLKTDDTLFVNPDGHGGLLDALNKNELFAHMHKNELEYLYYFQVDNPLVNILDPAFLGYHVNHDADVSTKVIKKSSSQEKIGVIGKINNKLGVIEYSDLPETEKTKKNENGNLLFGFGSIAIHIFSIEFLCNMGGALPIHLAEKKVNAFSFTGSSDCLSEKEAIKCETFIFDTIPLASKAIFVETSREEEFAPIKNKTGIDSPETSKKAQIKKWLNWIVFAGLSLAPEYYDDIQIEISPLFALDKYEFNQKVIENETVYNQLEKLKFYQEDVSIYIE